VTNHKSPTPAGKTEDSEWTKMLLGSTGIACSGSGVVVNYYRSYFEISSRSTVALRGQKGCQHPLGLSFRRYIECMAPDGHHLPTDFCPIRGLGKLRVIKKDRSIYDFPPVLDEMPCQ